MKGKFHGIIRTVIWAVICVILIVVFCVGISIASTYDRPLTGFFGSIGGGSTGGKAVFEADNSTQEDIDARAAEVSSEIVKEGAVLLQNENSVLPMKADANVSVFGITSNYWSTSEKLTGNSNNAFTAALIDEGININTTLRSLYKSNTPHYGAGSSMGDGSGREDWTIDELSIDKYTDSITSTYSSFNDDAIIILTRGNSEGSDIPMYMGAQEGDGTDDDSYLTLTTNEKNLIEHVIQNFDNVILIVNSPAFLDMEDISTYDGIDSIVWVAGTGDVELNSLVQLLTGKENFSGRTVDTYVYNNKTMAPSSQNFGDYRFTKDGEIIDYSYVNYAEGIYVGYKYYETRYEDSVLQPDYYQGTYDYDATVAYPFGYGLSYTTFDWSGFNVEYADGTYTATLNVKNSGSTYSGKDVVELYIQSPFTTYDQTNGVEKASVQLVGYAKTGLLAPGADEDVTITFTDEDIAAWDSSYSHDGVTGAYMLDAGNWYVTAAINAHAAINNILASETLTGEQSGRMSGSGDSSLVKQIRDGAEQSYITTSSDTGVTLKNNFADVQLSDATYLSRTNWSQVESGLTYQDGSKAGVSELTTKDGTVYTHSITDTNYATLTASGWSSTGNPNDPTDTSIYPAITTGADNGVVFEDMFGVPYSGTYVDEDGNEQDADAQWDAILDELSLDDMVSIYCYGGYGTVALSSINKPASTDYDGPARILNLFSGAESFNFPVEIVMAATWNNDLLADMGSCMGDQCLLEGISGWYAPAMDTHRSLFGGRVFEYYSEDGVLAGNLAAAEINAVQAKGVYAFMKHFALNDQETNRGANGRYAAFATEQAMREIYLKPFQISVEKADCHAVMASMNRVGFRYAITNYALLTETLRGEWGFKGTVVTDYISGLSEEDSEAGLAAGLDIQLITYQNSISSESLAKPGVQYMLRETMHNNLYTQANSLLLNGYSSGFATYKLMLIIAGIVILIYMAISGYLVLKYSWFKKAEEGKARAKLTKADFILAIVAGAVFAVLIIILLIWFCVSALPALQQAFTL